MILIDKKVNEYIQHYQGEENAISGKDLEQAFRLDGAEIRRIINRLRNNGVPICSDTNGYFYALKQLDIDRTIQSFNSRIIKMQRARNGLVKAKRTLQDTPKGAI